MTEQEWLEIGYDKHIIEISETESIPFHVAFGQWFVMKRGFVKPQSLDRIESTWNKYYKGSFLFDKCISKITEDDIITFLKDIFSLNPKMTYKEYSRVMQIISNVLVYMRDRNLGGVRLYDWDRIKRYLPIEKLNKDMKKEYALKDSDIQVVFDNCVNFGVFPDGHKSAALCLCMNFYLGLRVGELAALTFDDFDFDKNVVKIYKTQAKMFDRTEDGSRLGTLVYRVVEDVKTVYSVREIPILPEVKLIYEKIKSYHDSKNWDSPYLAYDGTDAVLYQSLERTLRNLCNLCGVPLINSHLIRKTFVTKLHFSGVPTRVISDLVGHSEIGTTENSYILNYRNNYDSLYNYMKDGLKYV